MTINYTIGGIQGEAIIYTTDNKDTEKQDKAQAKLFKLLNIKKLSATYNIK